MQVTSRPPRLTLSETIVYEPSNTSPLEKREQYQGFVPVRITTPGWRSTSTVSDCEISQRSIPEGRIPVSHAGCHLPLEAGSKANFKTHSPLKIVFSGEGVTWRTIIRRPRDQLQYKTWSCYHNTFTNRTKWDQHNTFTNRTVSGLERWSAPPLREG
jgi:hypothetical protein